MGIICIDQKNLEFENDGTEEEEEEEEEQNLSLKQLVIDEKQNIDIFKNEKIFVKQEEFIDK